MKIINIDIKQDKNGNDYKALTLDDDRKLNVFDRHSCYGAMIEGLELTEIELEKQGRFWNLKDKQHIPSTRGYKGIEKAMERKEGYIATAQTRREDSIKMAASARDATLIVTTFYPELVADELKEGKIKTEWQKWRKWLHDALDVPFI